MRFSPDSISYPNLPREKINGYLAHNEYSAATSALQVILNQKPYDGEAGALMVYLAVKSQLRKEASNLLRHLEHYSTNRYYFFVARGYLNWGARDLSNVAPDFARALKVAANEHERYVAEFNLAHCCGETETLKAKINKYQSANYNLIKDNFALGTLLRRQLLLADFLVGATSECEVLAQEYANTASKSAEAQITLAEVQFSSSSFVPASENYLQSLNTLHIGTTIRKYDPLISLLRLRIGTLQAYQGRFEEAKKEYDLALGNRKSMLGSGGFKSYIESREEKAWLAMLEARMAYNPSSLDELIGCELPKLKPGASESMTRISEIQRQQWGHPPMILGRPEFSFDLGLLPVQLDISQVKQSQFSQEQLVPSAGEIHNPLVKGSDQPHPPVIPIPESKSTLNSTQVINKDTSKTGPQETKKVLISDKTGSKTSMILKPWRKLKWELSEEIFNIYRENPAKYLNSIRRAYREIFPTFLLVEKPNQPDYWINYTWKKCYNHHTDMKAKTKK
jgi:tetratricopeptide (TPR) repeat protein